MVRESCGPLIGAWFSVGAKGSGKGRGVPLRTCEILSRDLVLTSFSYWRATKVKKIMKCLGKISRVGKA